MSPAELFWIAGAVTWVAATVSWACAFYAWRRQRELRYGVSGSAFNEKDRDRATSRLRDRSPW